MKQHLEPRDPVTGHCGGVFGRTIFLSDGARVEAAGPDWIVVRDDDDRVFVAAYPDVHQRIIDGLRSDAESGGNPDLAADARKVLEILATIDTAARDSAPNAEPLWINGVEVTCVSRMHRSALVAWVSAEPTPAARRCVCADCGQPYLNPLPVEEGAG